MRERLRAQALQCAVKAAEAAQAGDREREVRLHNKWKDLMREALNLPYSIKD